MRAVVYVYLSAVAIADLLLALFLNSENSLKLIYMIEATLVFLWTLAWYFIPYAIYNPVEQVVKVKKRYVANVKLPDLVVEKDEEGSIKEVIKNDRRVSNIEGRE